MSYFNYSCGEVNEGIHIPRLTPWTLYHSAPLVLPNNNPSNQSRLFFSSTGLVFLSLSPVPLRLFNCFAWDIGCRPSGPVHSFGSLGSAALDDCAISVGNWIFTSKRNSSIGIFVNRTAGTPSTRIIPGSACWESLALD